jgi:hypothetical protein
MHCLLFEKWRFSLFSHFFGRIDQDHKALIIWAPARPPILGKQRKQLISEETKHIAQQVAVKPLDRKEF